MFGVWLHLGWIQNQYETEWEFVCVCMGEPGRAEGGCGIAPTAPGPAAQIVASIDGGPGRSLGQSPPSEPARLVSTGWHFQQASDMNMNEEYENLKFNLAYLYICIFTWISSKPRLDTAKVMVSSLLLSFKAKKDFYVFNFIESFQKSKGLLIQLNLYANCHTQLKWKLSAFLAFIVLNYKIFSTIAAFTLSDDFNAGKIISPKNISKDLI